MSSPTTTLINNNDNNKSKNPNVIPTPGRKRRASALTRLLGHMAMQQNNPQPVWIIGQLSLEKTLNPTELRRLMLPRVLAIPRFRSKLVVHGRGGHYEEVEFDVGYHFETALYGERATMEQIDQVIANQNSWKFDPNRPLWKFVHIPETEDGGSVIISVINHCMGDGVALVNVLLTKLCDGVNEPESTKKAVHAGKRRTGPPVSMVKRIGMKFYGAYEAGTMTMWRHDKGNPLVCNKSTPEKIVASCPDTIPLDKVKKIAKMLGNNATVNDVLLGIFSKMIKMFFLEVGATNAATGKVKVRAQFPINVRSSKEGRENKDGDPNNRFSFGFITLPLKYDTAKDMIGDIKRQVDLIKVSPSGHLQLKQIPGYVAMLPRKILIDTLLGAANIATINISNVPGPQAQLTFGGVPVKRISFFLFSGVGFYVGLFSNNGQVSVSLNMDKSIGVDPKEVGKHWLPAFENVYKEICGSSSSDS
jgi:diacylglycerol O-acyltransferase